MSLPQTQQFQKPADAPQASAIPDASGADPLQQEPKPARFAMPEDDPNLQLQEMIANRKNRPAKAKQEEQKEQPKQPAAAEPAKQEAPEGKEEWGDLSPAIAKVLNFRSSKTKQEAAQKPAEAAAPVQEAAAVEAAKQESPAAANPAEPEKTIVSKRKPAQQQPQIDTAKIAAEAAVAAVRAMPQQQQDKAALPEEALTGDDRHEYEVAKFMAASDPRFKDAPRAVIEHVKKSGQYASQWERENPGKTFDPDDNEHNDFFESIEKPWSDSDFRNAEIEMAAERIADKKIRGTESKLRELEESGARSELKVVAESTLSSAASHIAKSIGEDVYGTISTKGFDSLMESDPITAEALAQVIGPLQPMIETIIQLDDPKSRIRFNEKNPDHMEWGRLLSEKEAQLSGTQDDQGRTFTTRHEYSRMNQFQRTKHFWLTPDLLISELVVDAAEDAKQRITKEKERQKRIALSLGYVLPDHAQKAQQSNGDHKPTPTSTQQATVKPLSPESGSGAKIDTKGTGSSSSAGNVLQATHSVLFSR